MNFAATLECPVVFFCRNNGYAIRYACACTFVRVAASVFAHVPPCTHFALGGVALLGGVSHSNGWCMVAVVLL